MAKRGRPGKPVDQEVQRRWVPELSGRACPTRGWCSKGGQTVFQLDCLHVGYRLLDSVRRKPGTAFRCLYCQDTGSQLWRRAVHKVEGLKEVGRIAFECHLLKPSPGGGKPFDIYLVDRKLAVEVDGSYHFSGSYRGVPATVQYAWDRQVDAACMQQGQQLVRLHYRDEGQWDSVVQAALDSQKVVIYSPSYGL